MTVAENLKHQGHLYGLRGQELKTRSEEVLRRVGLSDRAKDYVETLSGGMQRRVELAKGLIHSPAVLLLDEPSTGLDPGARRDMWQYLQTLRDQEGVSILVTTHLMEEAEHCDRLAILNQGNLVALGSPAQLKSAIGGDVVLFETASAEAARSLAERMGARFGVQPSVLGSTVRLERPEGHRLVTAVVEAFPGEVDGISVARPIARRRIHSTHRASLLDRCRGEGDSMATLAATAPRARQAVSPGIWLPAYSLWQREIVRFYRQKARVAGVIASPLIFWVVLGAGFAHSFTPGLDRSSHYLGYFFPGSRSHDCALYRDLQHDVADSGPERGLPAFGAGGAGKPVVHCSGQGAGRRDAGRDSGNHLPGVCAAGWACT